MSDMEKFLSSLDEEQKRKLKEALEQDGVREAIEGDSHLEWENEGGSTQSKDSASAPPIVEADFVVKNRSLNQNRRRSKVKAGKNQWVDNGEYKDVDTPLPEDFEKTPRRKAAPKKTPVECHMCGKTFKQDSRYSYGDFPRCNKCTGR
jgi:hypothetical protein